jgi:beta-lactamase superfamily II metal-dependent hydrolase
MPDHATLELHFINVGQGDSILLVLRDLAQLATRVRARAGNTAFGTMDPLDHLPYATANRVDLRGTVQHAVLIDGGDDEYGGNVVEYLEQHGVLDPDNKGYVPHLDLVISHYHDDHIGGARSLFKELVKETVTTTVTGRGRNPKTRTVTKTVEREQARYRPASVFLTLPDEDEDPGSLRLTNLRKDIDEANAHSTDFTIIYDVLPGGRWVVEEDDFETNEPVQFALGTGAGNIPVTLTAYAGARSVYEPISGTLTDVESGTSTPDQNDRSIMFVLQYGSFRAYLGGDLAGDGGADGGNLGGNAVDTSTKRFFSQHADVESVLNPVLEANLPATATPTAGQPKFRVPGQCDVLKANHHASSSSVDVFTLSTTRPVIAVIPAGVKARFHRHPTQEVLNRMSPGQTAQWGVRTGSAVQGPVANTLAGIYVTEIAQRYKNKAFNVLPREAKIVGDIIVRPVDESVVAVQQATAFGTPLRIQVYATGDQTGVDGAGTALRPTDQGVPRAPYPIGPFMHTSNLH